MAATMYTSKFLGYKCLKIFKIRNYHIPLTNYMAICNSQSFLHVQSTVGYSETAVEQPNRSINLGSSTATSLPYVGDVCVDLGTEGITTTSCTSVKAFKFNKSVVGQGCRLNSRILSYSKNYVFKSCKKSIESRPISFSIGPHRHFSENGGSRKEVPRHLNLMDFPKILAPNIFKSVRNWVLSNFVITPYFDREFNLSAFCAGSKKAVEVVSRHLSRGEYNELQGLVTPEAIEDLKHSISLLSVKQRQELAIVPDDIAYSFAYEVGVMFNDDDKDERRFVEITMCYHVIQGGNVLKQPDQSPSSFVQNNVQLFYEDNHITCNYRFIREFTKGVEDQWTINALNHFKMIELRSLKEHE